MSARYEIRIYNTLGALQAVITEWRVLTYSNRVNNVGTYNLEMDGDSPFVDLFETDGRVEIRRRDIDASPVIDWNVDFAALQRVESRRYNEEGLSIFNSSGASYEHLLVRRGMAFTKGSTGADKSGVGETVMKDYVRENAGVGATAPPSVVQWRDSILYGRGGFGERLKLGRRAVFQKLTRNLEGYLKDHSH